MNRPRRRWGRGVASGVVAFTFLTVVVVLTRASAAATCADTGEPAPAFVTLMASKTVPNTDAWVVTPQCEVETISRSTKDVELRVGAKGIERVVSVPTNVWYISLSGNPLSQGVDLSVATKMREAQFIDSRLDSNPGRLMVPPALESFSLYNASLVTSLDGFNLPRTLAKLVLTKMPSLKTIKTAMLPSRLSALTKLVYFPTKATVFEVRQSDVATLEQLEEFIVEPTQPSCSGSAVLKQVKGVTICVISDTEFETKFGDSASPSNGSTEDTQGSSTGSQSNDVRGSLQDPSNGSDVRDSKSIFNPSDGGNSSSFEPSQDSVAAVKDSSASSSAINVTLLVSALLIGVVAALYYVFVRRNRRRNPVAEIVTSDKFDAANTPSSSSGRNPLSGQTTPPSASDARAIDFRSDKEFVRHRIDHVQLGTRIARGGYGVVYRGTYEGRVVAIKQMLPDAWQHDATVASFLDEIRVCARLNHAKIVTFVGVSWNSLRDLSVITEFMSRGDLHSMLRQYPESSGREWSDEWSREHLRTKTLIAMDIAEAIVYLHSFDSPIIHRDLKAKNVLLDPVGNAKLSDFGISRTVSIDETMTSEIGTVAWIAPEVLRGDRYSEKADIFSLGVLLVELDRCCHPYADEPVLMMGSSSCQAAVRDHNTSDVAHKNTQIAVMVSAGKLKPSPSQGCPEAVSEVIKNCLSFEASDRPTAMEVCYALCQIRKAIIGAKQGQESRTTPLWDSVSCP